MCQPQWSFYFALANTSHVDNKNSLKKHKHQFEVEVKPMGGLGVLAGLCMIWIGGVL